MRLNSGAGLSPLPNSMQIYLGNRYDKERRHKRSGWSIRIPNVKLEHGRKGNDRKSTFWFESESSSLKFSNA